MTSTSTAASTTPSRAPGCCPGASSDRGSPIAIAAGGSRGLRLTADLADAWITYGDTSHRERDAAATERIVRGQVARIEERCAETGRDPATLDRIYLIGNTDERPLASVDAFVDFAGRYGALGFTDLVFHHPRPDDPVWDEPEEIVERIAGTRHGPPPGSPRPAAADDSGIRGRG